MTCEMWAALLPWAGILCHARHHHEASWGGGPPAHVHYDVWDGDEAALEMCGDMGLAVPVNSSFYDVMLHAARVDRHYRFKADVMHGQHYITSIGGKQYDRKNGFFWMIYRLKNPPNPLKPPTDEQLTPKGVDRTYVSDGDFFLFWLKKVNWAQMNNATSRSEITGQNHIFDIQAP
ncbi:uncharacterized protein CG3556-like [Bacillus rossius redtenbacheri]|uniref:uncharacterized protein CG3556-like n=1 Tax=Bacillus rossius redtenbacheri TaxID=93214 RepID=UPI002FDCBE5E